MRIEKLKMVKIIKDQGEEFVRRELENNNYFDEYNIEEAVGIIDNYNTSDMIEFFEIITMKSFNYKEKAVLNDLIKEKMKKVVAEDRNVDFEKIA